MSDEKKTEPQCLFRGELLMTSDEKTPPHAIVPAQMIDDVLGAITGSKPVDFPAALRAIHEGVWEKQPLRKPAPHKLVFGATGKAGEQKVIEVRPECLFRGTGIDAKDTLDGAGTIVQMLLVGKRLQQLNQPGPALETREMMRAIREGALTFEMDTCQQALSICLGILFTKDCEFRAEISGQAIGAPA